MADKRQARGSASDEAERPLWQIALERGGRRLGIVRQKVPQHRNTAAVHGRTFQLVQPEQIAGRSAAHILAQRFHHPIVLVFANRLAGQFLRDTFCLGEEDGHVFGPQLRKRGDALTEPRDLGGLSGGARAARAGLGRHGAAGQEADPGPRDGEGQGHGDGFSVH